ncbi:MAG TPA: hypothetical protein VF836_08285 [Gemmatimonadaceae bacterium]
MIATAGRDGSNDWYGLLPLRSRHHVPRKRLGFNKLNEEEADMDATTVAVDLAKDVFEVATANRAGRILERNCFSTALTSSLLRTIGTRVGV